MAPGDAPQRRRQGRGKRRIEQILHAAAGVFAEHGYESTTTNAIATAAGISPGSLYQYFRNKDDIAHALAEHYATRLAQLRDDALGSAAPEESTEQLLDRVLCPLVEFNLAHPGFKSLFARSDMPLSLRAAIAPVHDAVHGQVTVLIGTALPELSTAETERSAAVAIQIVRAMMPLIVEASAAERAAYVAELRAALSGYLHARSAV